MSLLRLDKAGLHYGTLTLLEDVDFNISRGEKIGLLGRNGDIMRRQKTGDLCRKDNNMPVL